MQESSTKPLSRSAVTPTPPGRRDHHQLPSGPTPEFARLGRTLRIWKQQVLAYFKTRGVSNGGTEAVNLVIEKTRRLAHGFRNFTNYRLRILLAASGNAPPSETQTMPNSEEPRNHTSVPISIWPLGGASG